MRAPSLLRSLVVRLTIVVVLALAVSYLVLYSEFREGLWGLEGQSIAVQVQDLREPHSHDRANESERDRDQAPTSRAPADRPADGSANSRHNE